MMHESYLFCSIFYQTRVCLDLLSLVNSLHFTYPIQNIDIPVLAVLQSVNPQKFKKQNLGQLKNHSNQIVKKSPKHQEKYKKN